MKQNIKGIHLELTESLKNKIDEKIMDFEKTIEKDKVFFDINIILSVNKLIHTCQIKLLLGSTSINVKVEKEDIYLSIDEAFKTLKDKCIKKEIKHKT